MKKLILALLLIPVIGCSQSPTASTYIQEIRKYRYEENIKFADKETTILTKKDFKRFSALDFFPIDTNYRIAAKFELHKDPKLFEMQTTTDRKPLYKTYGIATFKLEGKTYVLQVYQDQELIQKPGYKDHLFVPFVDKTSGNESYGGGRYLDIQQPKDDIIILDFNKSYNPYCAYNERYSCPIVPRENYLETKIEAGVKAFEK